MNKGRKGGRRKGVKGDKTGTEKGRGGDREGEREESKPLRQTFFLTKYQEVSLRQVQPTRGNGTHFERIFFSLGETRQNYGAKEQVVYGEE